MAREQGQLGKIQGENLTILIQIVASDPTATLDEIRTELTRRTGLKVGAEAVASTLRRNGINRVPADQVAVLEIPVAGPARYGYTDAHRRQEPEQTYLSCLTDAEWALVSDLFDHEGGRGLPPRVSRRTMVNACCYVARTGCSWRMLPKDFPKWQNVYRTFRRWTDQGRFEAMHDRLRDQWREREGRTAEPTAAVIDAQSNRSSPQGGESGFDAGKKVKGRKRHLVVDTFGLLLAVSVTAASVQDRHGAHPVVAQAMAKYPSIETVFADAGYAGQCAQTISQTHDIRVQVVRHPTKGNAAWWVRPEQQDLFSINADASGFVVLAKRWVVERTHAWNERARRLIMHHDRLLHVCESWVWLTQARHLLRRLAA